MSPMTMVGLFGIGVFLMGLWAVGGLWYHQNKDKFENNNKK